MTIERGPGSRARMLRFILRNAPTSGCVSGSTVSRLHALSPLAEIT